MLARVGTLKLNGFRENDGIRDSKRGDTMAGSYEKIIPPRYRAPYDISIGSLR